MQKAQTSLEYLLLIGAVITFAILAFYITRTNVFGTAGMKVENTSKGIVTILATVQQSALQMQTPIVVTQVLPQTAATVKWTTDLPATSYVEYVKVSTGEKKFAGSNELVANHAVFLPSLQAGVIYQYKVTSCNPSSGCAVYQNSFTI